MSIHDILFPPASVCLAIAQFWFWWQVLDLARRTTQGYLRGVAQRLYTTYHENRKLRRENR